jgi:DNA (cytosine-5)-methyltransferase 1
MGLHRAGFEVVGVDIEPQPRYPFQFCNDDALRFSLDGFDLIWASPPCQNDTAYKRRPGHVRPVPMLIGKIRSKLALQSSPHIIENVPGAPLFNPIQLCGSSFGLDVRRHRLFECSFPVLAPPCSHGWQTPRFPPASNRKNLRSTVEVGVWRIPLNVQQRAMGIDWMTREELSQAIPPAYAEFLGRAAMAQLRLCDVHRARLEEGEPSG